MGRFALLLGSSVLACIITSTLGLALAAPIARVARVVAQENPPGQPLVQSVADVLRSVPASKGHLVKKGTQLKSSGGGSPITCCKSWNSSTGGTGCYAQPGDECPGGHFKVDCGPSGCW
jgi:hypothetical protein